MHRSEFYWSLNDNICSKFSGLKIFNSCLRISLPYEFIFTSKFSFTDICNSVHPSMNSKCFGLTQDKGNLFRGIEICSGVAHSLVQVHYKALYNSFSKKSLFQLKSIRGLPKKLLITEYMQVYWLKRGIYKCLLLPVWHETSNRPRPIFNELDEVMPPSEMLLMLYENLVCHRDNYYLLLF